ncbi:MAG: hypothetical protein ACF8PG_10210 [Maioricimonas sp. JB045]
MYRNLYHHAVLLSAAILVIAADGQSASAGSLNDALQTVTEQVKTYLDEKGENAISIGTFSGPKTGTGRAIETDLSEALTKAGIEVVDELDAKWEVRGSFAIDTSGKFPIVALTVRLFDGSGSEISQFRDRFQQATAEERNLVNEANATTESTSTSTQAESSVASASNPPASTGSPAESTSPASTTNPPSTNSQASTTTEPPTPPAPSGDSTQVASNDTPTPPNPAASDATSSDSSATGITEGVPIDNSTDVAVLSGATADLEAAVRTATQVSTTTPVAQASISREVRNKAIEARDTALKEAIATPQFHQVNSNVISASSSSQFHVEVLVAPQEGAPFQPIAIETRGGFPFVPLAEGNLYAVRVHNNSQFDVGVELLLDGVNSLHFADNPDISKTGKWVIAAGTTGTIQGWFVNASTVDSFLITSVPDGVASKIGSPQRIGNITAAFFPAWTGSEVPAFEQLLAAGTGRGEIATGRGPSQQARSTIVERHFGTQPLSIISLRYKNPPLPVDLPTDVAP